MSIEDVYIEFITRIERNATNDNLDINNERFVIIFNAAQLRFANYILKNNIGDNTKFIRVLLKNKSLKQKGKTKKYSSFELPEDFLDKDTVDCTLTKGACKGSALLHHVMSSDTNILYSDFHNKPNFDWLETYYTVTSDTIDIYKTDFDVVDVTMKYFKSPKEVEMEGYKKEDGTNSKNIDPDWKDTEIDSILKICVKMYHLGVNDLSQINIDLSDPYRSL